MIVAGLTGGIATGKSTVAAIFRTLGANILDADNIAHTVYRQGLPAWRQIVDHFGETILLPNGEIDRQQLGQLVFHQPEAMKQLNAIVHPHVKTRINNLLETMARDDPQRLAVLDVPLLFETRMDAGLVEVIVVYAPRRVQIQRLMQRDGLTRMDALDRIGAQMSIEEKRQRATMVIDNSGALTDTRRRTQNVFKKIKARYGIV